MFRTSISFATMFTSLGLVASLGACTKPGGGSADVEELTERIEKLESEHQKFAEVEEFVRPIMSQQKAQQAQKEASEPDPDARFAVDVTGNASHGPAGAAVTIIEAFDFA